MSARSAAAGRIALVVGSTVLVLGVLEVAARVARRSQGGGREENTIALYTEPDPRLGWRKKPGARATYHRREYTVEVQVNSRGLRDRERGHQAEPGVFRLLALGDSFVEGYTVPLEEAVGQVLERELGATGCPVEVVNGGTSGWSTDQEYIFYKDEGARYGAQVVVLFFYYNDVLFNDRDNYFGRPKPRLVMKETGLELANEPVPVPRPRDSNDARADMDETASALVRSALVSWIRERLKHGAPGAHDALARLGLWSPLGGSEPGEEMRVYKTGPTPRIDGAWASTARILEALTQETAARGSQLLVAYVPNRMEVRDRDWELTRRAYAMEEGAWDRGLPLRRLKAIGDAAGFPVLDLTPALRRADAGLRDSAYFTYDPHWTALGHRVAAAEVSVALRQRGWIPSCEHR
jgi:lysophospholipase L1-like esterase